jgi:hypothetical protein
VRSYRAVRYLCDYCNRGMFKKPSMEKHEKYCFHNPARSCKTCEFHGDMGEHSMDAMIAAMNEKGPDAARPLAENCPACLCSALIQARKRAKVSRDDGLLSYLWCDVSFDYKAESTAFRTAVYNSRPEDF